MPDAAELHPPPEPWPTEVHVDAVLYEFKRDAREAIRALLADIATLAEDANAAVSRGFVRGHDFRQGPLR